MNLLRNRTDRDFSGLAQLDLSRNGVRGSVEVKSAAGIVSRAVSPVSIAVKFRNGPTGTCAH